jgi:hypothetical protein
MPEPTESITLEFQSRTFKQGDSIDVFRCYTATILWAKAGKVRICFSKEVDTDKTSGVESPAQE